MIQNEKLDEWFKIADERYMIQNEKLEVLMQKMLNISKIVQDMNHCYHYKLHKNFPEFFLFSHPCQTQHQWFFNIL